MQNVIVLGGSYGGARAARVLAQGLPNEYRIILIDRNSHVNHLYVIPRLSVLGGHEYKAFVPYTHIFDPDIAEEENADPTVPSHHLFLQAHVTALSPHSVTLDRAFPELGFPTCEIPFVYCVYALGNRMPAPIDLWSEDPNAVTRQPGTAISTPSTTEGPEVGRDIADRFGGTKQEAIEWLKRCQERIRRAGSVLCVGGGALGIQYATDIKSIYPEKQVTLLHSRHRLLPRFDYEMHTEILHTLEELEIDLILGERLDLESTKPENIKFNERGQRVVRTLGGREVAADLLLLCTGQSPNTELIESLSPRSVDPVTKQVHVLRTMQLGVLPDPADIPLPPSEENSPRTSFVELPSDGGLASTFAQTVVDYEDEDDLDLMNGEAIDDEPLPETPYPHVFVIGDVADAFGAIKAGHTAHFQGEVAARNIIRLATAASASASASEVATAPVQGQGVILERYVPGLPAIKVSLGVGQRSVFQVNAYVGRKDTVDPDDLDAALIWPCFGWKNLAPEDMYL